MKRLLCAALALLVTPCVFAAGLGKVRFVVVDPATRQPIPGVVTVDDGARSQTLPTILFRTGLTRVFDTRAWVCAGVLEPGTDATVIEIPAGTSVTLQEQSPKVKEITIKVTASRLPQNKAPVSTSGSNRGKDEINKFVNTTGGDSKNLTKGQAGVAEDSAGQQHVRGEHTDITYVVDGVPLPDTLSGRQGSIVVPSTIENLEILTGGFAPEFGGQTAAVLNITTLPGARKASEEMAIQGGSFATWNGDFTAVGPIGRRANYVLNFGATRTDNASEPQQPDNQTAHNEGSSRSLFGKFRFNASAKDALTLTLSHNPDALEIGNRTGLPSSYASAGQGFGFQGLRNRDGSRPDVAPDNAGTMGSENILLPNQQDAGNDIRQNEVSEFSTLSWRRHFGANDSLQLSATLLHSAQEIRNGNPLVDVLNLPVDSSIEYSPDASRNIHHMQLVGSYAWKAGPHALKIGFLYDKQSGRESYRFTPGSRLALNALAALAPSLVPAGTTSDEVDVNGNPVYTPTSSEIPSLKVRREGSYKAAYIQDTWQPSKRFAVNYGVRADWYDQEQNLGQGGVDSFELSPRLNFSYGLTSKTTLKWAYNHLFNTPPLAQGAIVGQPLQPEIVDQYDIALEHQLSSHETLTLAYYYKQIKNMIDVGLLIPGSEIGLYSAVNLDRGGVHGLEVSYDLFAKKGVGWDGYFNYSLSAAKPNGKDNTGEDVEEFNDHDQRHTIGAGLAYSFKNGASLAVTYQYGSGLASSIVPPSADRTPRQQFDLRFSTGDKLFGGRGGIGIDIENVFDERKVINFQSAFSGTRFQQGRRILITANFKI